MSIRLVLLACGCALSGCAAPSPLAPATGAEGGAQTWWSVVGPRIHQGALSFSFGERAASAESPDGLLARLDAGGMRLQHAEDMFGVETVGFGREADILSLSSAEPTEGDCLEGAPVEPDGSCARRVELAREGMTEWWANQQVGLQHGWDLHERPEGEGLVVIAVALTGGTVELDADGLSAWVQGAGGSLLRYGDLGAWDADGEPLDAAFSLEDGLLLVLVDDEGARYPLLVDPLATSATSTLTGPSSASQFGFSVAGAGDVNNDGYDDVIVGAPGYSTSSGRAYVYHGNSSGVSTTASRTLSGSTAAYFGYSVSGAGDVNNDGYSDVIVGAPGVSTLRGAAYVYHGSSSGVSGTVSTTLSGSSSNDQFGFATAGAGDVNNDGYSDVIVGSNNASSGAGRAAVFHGSSAGISSTASRTITGSSGYYLGEAVAGVGDVDGDGYDDVAIGLPGYSSSTGRVVIHEGSSSGIGSSAASSLTGSASSGYFGGAVAGAGDVNGDGYDDVIVGASGASSGTGAAYVFHGRSSGTATSAATSLTGRTSSGAFGIAVDGIGDADGDGYDDVLVGAYNVAGGTGAAYAYPGSSSGVSSTVGSTLSGTGTATYFGIDVAGAGDVNADGYTDAIIGADYASSGYGAAYVFLGEAQDGDGDGYDASEDCDDADATVHPGATDTTGDGEDSDCDGIEVCYADADADRYRTSTTVMSSDGDCSDAGEALSSLTSGDCDDTDSTIRPGATEITGDGVDQNCDGDESCYVDDDEDDYRGSGSVASADEDCTDAGEASTSVPAGDCDDDDASVNPGASETVGDGVDQDCDDREICYDDLDGDGYRSDDDSTSTDADCSDAGEALATDPDGDCDDRDADINPGAEEIPLDGTDQDCDGSDGYDGDGDGHDDESMGGDDCDDSDERVYPGAEEEPYDDIDQDCDGRDLVDVDSDGVIAEEAQGDDCDDEDATVYPDAPELDDGLDNDCDGFSEDDDPDEDGISTQDEIELGTDPDDADSDGDGVSDGEEAENGTDPLVRDNPEGGGQDGTSAGGCSYGLDSFAALLVLGAGLGRRRRVERSGRA